MIILAVSAAAVVVAVVVFIELFLPQTQRRASSAKLFFLNISYPFTITTRFPHSASLFLRLSGTPFLFVNVLSRRGFSFLDNVMQLGVGIGHTGAIFLDRVPAHCGTKTGHFGTSNHSLSHERGSERSERASERVSAAEDASEASSPEQMNE